MRCQRRVHQPGESSLIGLGIEQDRGLSLEHQPTRHPHVDKITPHGVIDHIQRPWPGRIQL